MKSKGYAIVAALLVIVKPFAAQALSPEDQSLCKEVATVVSDQTSKVAATITFSNRSRSTIYVKWIKNMTEKIDFLTVAAGARNAVTSFVGHVWLLEDSNGQCLAVIKISEPRQVVKIP